MKGHLELSELVIDVLLLLGKTCLGVRVCVCVCVCVWGGVLGKSNRLLSFDTTWTEQKTVPPTTPF
jgi:hypothetical protein